jgi:hypothetical protein
MREERKRKEDSLIENFRVKAVRGKEEEKDIKIERNFQREGRW